MKKIICLVLSVLLVLPLFSSAALADDAVASFQPTAELTKLTEDLFSIRFDGEDYFEEFLAAGGASEDKDIYTFLFDKVPPELMMAFLFAAKFGCSVAVAETPDGDRIFGRNFDWNPSTSIIVESHPTTGYASIATTNADFILNNSVTSFPDALLALTGIYAPLDGMNETGLCVSVNLIREPCTTNQQTGKPGITTTTAIRMLLNKAATVDEAVDLMKQYDFHPSRGYTVHFIISDKSGRTVCIEYIDQEMSVVEADVVTNSYVTPAKFGVGNEQSNIRYRTLKNALANKNGILTEADMRDALKSVCKANYHDGAVTEWSIVFNQTQGTATYYHREDYTKGYQMTLGE